MKTNILYVLSFFLLGSLNLDAQSFKDKYFHSLGYLFEFNKTPGVELGNTGEHFQFKYYSLSYQYEGRVNITNLNDNSALSVSLAPSVGLAFPTDDLDGYGSINIPVFVNIEFGAGSTYDSDADVGFTLGLGLNHTRFPLFGLDLPDGSDFKKSYTTPVIKASLRKFSSKGNHLRQYFIHFWPFGSKQGTNFSGDPEDVNTLVLRFGMSKYMGY